MSPPAATATLDDADAALQLRRATDDRNFSQSLAALGRLLGEGDPKAAAAGGPVLAATLQRVLQAGGVSASFRPTDPGLDAWDTLQQLAQQAQVATRQVTLAGRPWWHEDAGPLLAFARDGSPLALLPVRGGGYRLEDAATGRSVEVDEALAADLDDTAWMFFRQFPARAMGLRDLLRFGLAGARADSLTMLACGLLGALLGLLTPYASGLLVDHVIPDGRSDALVQLVLLLASAAVATAAFELARALAALRIEGRLGNATEAAVIDRLLHLPAPFFRAYAAGDLAQRAFAIHSILHLVTSTTQSTVFSWVFGLISFFYMYWLNWQLGLLATVLVLLVLAVTVAANAWRLRIERRMFGVQGAIASRVLQILNGIAKLRGGGAEHRAFVLWARDFGRQKELDLQARRIGNGLAVFNAAFLVVAAGVLYGAIAFFHPGFSPGVFVAFNTAFMQFLGATLALAAALTETLNVIPLYERAGPILHALPEQEAGQAQAAPLAGDVEISRVSFRYTEDGPAVLDDISIRVRPGEFVAFVGPSGSGKSTLFRLLLGFEQPQTGAVYYDQQDLATLDVRSVRRQLGVVLQNGKLMPGDIFTNIVGSSACTIDDAWEAARMAGLDEDIRAMPMGMHTVISEGAATISGGQRQRLMIARALVKRPAVVLFDEATSALDNRTQAVVARSVQELKATRIVIAHRLSTIQQADRICVIVGGRLVESGTYEELMARGGAFAELARRQQP